MTDDEEPDLLSVAQAAERLGLTVSQAYYRVQNDTFPGDAVIRVGRHWRVSRRHLDVFLAGKPIARRHLEPRKPLSEALAEAQAQGRLRPTHYAGGRKIERWQHLKVTGTPTGDRPEPDLTWEWMDAGGSHEEVFSLEDLANLLGAEGWQLITAPTSPPTDPVWLLFRRPAT